MTEDASLDDFLDAGSEGPAAEDPDASEEDASDDEGAAAGADDAPDVDAASDADFDPASSVSAVSPGGTSCESCGATVVQRWTDGEAAVCAECKEW